MSHTIHHKTAIIDHVGSKAGMDYYTYLLARGMVHNGIAPLIISNFTVPDSNIKCYRYFIGHTANKLHKAYNHITAFLRSAFVCRREGCRHVVVHLFSYEPKDVYALRVLKLFNISVTAIVHDVESFARADSQRLQRKIFFDLTDRLIVHNRFSYEAVTAHYGASLAKKMKIVPHGHFHSLDKGTCTRDAARNRLGMEEDMQYLLFFGQIKEVKGLEILLKAMPLLPDNVRLVIAGKPWKNDFEQYQNIISDTAIEQRVVLHIGFVEDEMRNLLFKACDLLILPYKQIFQSGVQLMAMSYKIPVVASNLQPMQEAISHGDTGFLFESESPSDLATQITYALSEPGRLKQVAVNAWERTKEQNDWNTIAREMVFWQKE